MLNNERAVKLLSQFGILSVIAGGLLIAAFNSFIRNEEIIATIATMVGVVCMMRTFVLYSKLYDHMQAQSRAVF